MKLSSLNRDILRLTVPAIVSNITMPLLGLSDTTVAGHLGSEIFIGAIAVGTMMQNVVFWLFGFLRMGTTGMTAQSFGANDREGISTTFSRSVMLGVIIGVTILLLQVPLKRGLLLLLGPDAAVAGYASQYFDICIWGAPAMLATMAMQGWLLGMQTTLLPMIVTISVNLLNIALSLLFVFVIGTGFPGVAYGTLTATWFGVFLAFGVSKYHAKGIPLRCSWRQLVDAAGLSRFFKINTDIFFRSACIIAVSLTVTAIGARLGAVTLAANAVIVQFFIFYSYCMDGFSFTGEALCGRFAGLGDRDGLLRAVKLLLGWAAVMAALFTLTYILFYHNIIRLITNEINVIAEITNYRLWIYLIPPLSALAFIYDGFFIGLTATRRMLIVTAISAASFMLLSFVNISSDGVWVAIPDNNRMWFAFIFYLFARGVLLAVQSKSVFSLKTELS